MSFTTSQEKNAVTLKVEAKDYPHAFADGARGLFHCMYNTDSIHDDERVEFALQADDIPSLYHAWLTELLSRADAESMVFGEFSVVSIQKVNAKQYVLMGFATGEKRDKSPREQKATITKIRTEKLSCKESGGKSGCSVMIDVQ
ncbi:MAG: archease [bacterium]|nr:archease [bacterium]